MVICPLENNSFEFEVKEKKVLKHLKNCPHFIRYLYNDYIPFYFPHINDSFYLLENKNVENILHYYYLLFNKLIYKIKNNIVIKNYEEYLFLKYDILLSYYLLYGQNYLISNINNSYFINKIKNHLNEKNIIIKNENFFINKDNCINNKNDSNNHINNNIDDNINININDNINNNINININDNINNNINDNINNNINDKINDNINKNINNYKNEINIDFNYINTTIQSYYYNIQNYIKDKRNIKEKEKKDQNILNNNLNIFTNNHNSYLENNKINHLSFLKLKSIYTIHKYKIINDIINFVDNIQNEKNNISIEKNEYNDDEIISIIIYLSIYLCCKLNIIKRIKNKTFNNKISFDNIELSIFFFIENISKHDIQNINLLFFLLYFNDKFYKNIKKILNKKIDNLVFQTNNLFVELAAGKGETARWVNFIFNYLNEIFMNFYFKYEINKNIIMNDKNCFYNYIKLDNKIDIKPQCKILIIEKETRRNKKEKINLYMQKEDNEKYILRIRTDICNFNITNFINFKTNKDKIINCYIPDIIYFYYLKNVYKIEHSNFLNDNKKQDEKKKDETYYIKQENVLNNSIFLICEQYLNSNLMIIKNYFNVNYQKLRNLLTNGNHNVLKVYKNMSHFLEYFNYKRIIFLAKHLCGNGTDLALKMITNCNKINKLKIYFIIATCCHHRCIVNKILGYNFLKKINMDEHFFQYVIRYMSGYASCDNKFKKNIGKKIKRIIDILRILYLMENGLNNTYLIKFVNNNITLENYAIVHLDKKSLNLFNFKFY